MKDASYNCMVTRVADHGENRGDSCVFCSAQISDGKQSGVNELSLDDRKIYGRDAVGRKGQASVRLGTSNP